MDWLQLFIFFFGLYAAYCVGHWVGYGKGEQDKKELTNEIIKLSNKTTFEINVPATHAPE